MQFLNARAIICFATFLALYGLCAMHAHAQWNFQARYGDKENVELGLCGIVVDSANGYAVVGEATIGRFNRDLLFNRMDAAGNLLWGRMYDIGEVDVGNAVVQVADGNFVITGYTRSKQRNTDEDLLLMKIDSADGEVLWCRIYPDMYDERGTSIIRTATGDDLIIGGFAYQETTGGFATADVDGLLLRTDRDGLVRWGNIYGSDSSCFFNTVSCGTRNRIIAGGYALTRDNREQMLMMSVDVETGIVLWTGTCGGPGNDRITGMGDIPLGYSVFTGITDSWGAGGNDMFVLQVHDGGARTELRTFGGPGHENAVGVGHSGAYNLPDRDGLVLAGSSFSTTGGHGMWDMCLVKTSALLTDTPVEFSRVYGSEKIDLARSLVMCSSDDGVLVTGSTAGFGTEGGTDVYLLRVDEQGTTGCAESDAGYTSTYLNDIPVLPAALTITGKIEHGLLVMPNIKPFSGYHIICPPTKSVMRR